jgi:hypothetical protein
MSGGGGKGGKQKTTQKMDPQALAMIKEMSAFGKEVAKMPYMPWTGNDVAAMTPQQVGGMQAFADMGNSFGMGMPTDVMAGMPTAKTDASGVSGYSSYPAYKEAAAKAASESPEAAKRYADFFDMPASSLFGDGSNYVPTSAPASSGSGNKGSPFSQPQSQQTSGSKGPQQMANLMMGMGR